MRNFDEKNITAAVVDAFQGTPDARLKTIMTSLVRHLHDFVREVELTTDEWTRAIDYLTRTGQSCTPQRQEFILLSDVLGISMLVDAINHRMPAGTTETTVLGPFYVQNPPELPHGFDVSRGVKGEPLFVEGSVFSATAEPVADAIVDIWQADSEGFYDVQRTESPGSTLRGRFRTDRQGRFHFWSIMPTSYPVPQDGTAGEMLRATARHPYRPAHLHFLIAAHGHETLVTHLFAAGNPYLDSDAVFAVKESLIREFTNEAPGSAPDGSRMDRPWRKLTCRFGLKPLAEQSAGHRAA
jgi:hydroxyquinol 1,2-dioxygenase